MENPGHFSVEINTAVVSGLLCGQVVAYRLAMT